MQLSINRVSNSISGAPPLNYALTISELSLFSFTHLSVSPSCPVLLLHCEPAKPDSQGAYQAFCQPGCLIVLSKHPPAFCLPPPPQKTSPGWHVLLPPFPSCLFYLTVCLDLSFSILSIVLCFVFTACLTSLFSPFTQEIHGLNYKGFLSK